jgi:hypothetical protein
VIAFQLVTVCGATHLRAADPIDEDLHADARPQGRSASHGDGLRPPLPPDTDEQEGWLSGRWPSSGRGHMWGRMRAPTARTTTTNRGPDPL